MKYIDATEIRELGILQEVNRVFFHPLGLSAEVEIESGALRIQDHRDDEEGVIYAPGVMDRDKVEKFREFSGTRRATRLSALGFVEQPLDFAEEGS